MKPIAMLFTLLLLSRLEGVGAAAETDFRVVSGVALDEAGKPLGGVRVRVLDGRAAEIGSQVTGSSGQFLFRGVPAGVVSAVAEAHGFQSAKAELTLGHGMVGKHVTFSLVRPGSACKAQGCVAVSALRPNESLRMAAAVAPVAAVSLPSAKPAATTTNSAADFTIQTAVAALAPPRFGFNFEANSESANNIFSQGGGMDPYDVRLSFTATNNGTANTFIDNDCASGGCPGTDFYASIASGYFSGAQARAYHFDGTAWHLINSGTVTSFTANSASLNSSDHTVTLNHSGSASQAGDALWLALDGVAAIPDYTKLDPRLQKYGSYDTMWTYETGATLSYMPSQPVGLTNLQPYSFVADGPPGDDDELPGAASPLSLKLTDSNAEFAGIRQYFLGQNPGFTEGLQVGHTYQISLWLKQTGIANGSVYFSIGNGGQVYSSNTFTGVTGTWQQFTFQFPGFAPPPSTVPNPLLRLDFQAPGTLWIDQVEISDTGYPALTIDPRVMAAWQAYAPATMRIWTNFANNSEGYSYWGLDSWLAADSEDHIDPGIGNIYELHELHSHLASSLAVAKSVGADPWLICNMSLSEAEWSNLIDYLTAPAGTGYAALRPASHPGPYTADFDHIYLEFGNEEWGTQETAVNSHYGGWVHYMLSQAIAGKAYFDPNKVKFIVNGFTIIPSLGSAAVAAAPEASIVDLFTYNSGDTSLIPSGATTYPDAYFQSDLFSLLRYTAAYQTSVKSLIDAQIAQQKADAANGLKYSFAVYEGGPGGDITSTQGDTSLAAAVGNLDTFLYSSLQGIQQQNFFVFSFGSGPYSSHSYLYDGFRPHPAWEALQMRNQYCHGDMVSVQTNEVPVSSDANQFPLIATYAFHETNASGVEQYDVVVLSRDLNNQTPVTLRLPATPAGSPTLYTLTGDPRANNDTQLNIAIGQSTVTPAQNFMFTMPPGSVYLFQFPVSSSTTPVPPTVAITSPSVGVMVAGSVTITANASAGAGKTIASVQFQVDGVNLGSAITGSGPTFSTSWSTAAAGNGTHVLTAIATDSANWQTTSAGVSVTVANNPLPPSVTSLTPSSGYAATQTFSALVSDPRGASTVNALFLLINRTVSAANGCYVEYFPSSNLLYLKNNAGTGLSAGITPGSSAMVSNSQCSVLGTGSSYSVSGNSATLAVALAFNNSTYNRVYVYASDKAGTNTGWVQKGTWGTPQGPTVTGVSGSGSPFTAVFSDPNGASSLNAAFLLLNTSLSGVNGCYIEYVPSSNLLFLKNDAGSGLAGSITPGSASTVSNSHCMVSGTGSSYSTAGDSATLAVAVSWSNFATPPDVYLWASDKNGLNSGWAEEPIP